MNARERPFASTTRRSITGCRRRPPACSLPSACWSSQLATSRVRVEFGGDVGTASPVRTTLGVGTRAERERQRIDEDRLAGAGFAGENGKATVEFEIERGDDDEVAYREMAKHGGRL